MPQNHLAVCIGVERRDFLPISQHGDISLHVETGRQTHDEFHRYQTAKQKALQKCRYLDERNIVLSPNLFFKSRSDISGTNDVSNEANSRWNSSQLNKPFANPEVNLSGTAAPDHSVPINPSVYTDSMAQKQNIVLGGNSTPLCIIRVSEALPMIEWIPTSSHVQPSEETAESLSANHETRSPQPAWKTASVHRLEWCHECPVDHLGSTSGTNGPYAARPKVIRRVTRVSGGYRAAPVQNSHVDDKLCSMCPYRLQDHHKALPKSWYKTGNHIYEYLCSSLQPQARHTAGGDQRDATQILEKTAQGQKQEFSEVIRVMDTQCQSGWPRNTETPPSPHHVTFSHILQVLQSKPANFPEVRGQRRHRAL